MLVCSLTLNPRALRMNFRDSGGLFCFSFCMSRPGWQNVWFSLVAAAIGFAFSYIVANADDFRVRIGFFALVSVALFLVMSGVARSFRRDG